MAADAAAVRFLEAVLEPVLDGATYAFESGSLSEVITPGDDESDLLVKVITGLYRLREGKIFVLGQDLGDLPRNRLDEVRRRVGIVFPDGGLISNLKVIENISLPLLYHSTRSRREIEKRARAVLERLGGDECRYELPGHLSAFRRRMAGFARVIAMEPEVVVYDRFVEGLHEEERELFLRTAFSFHDEKPGRTTIFLSPHSASLEVDEKLSIIHLTRGRLE